MAVEIVSFPNGRRKLIYEGYIYVKQKDLHGGKTSWESSFRRNARSCKAKLQTRDGILVRTSNTHTCAEFGHPEKVAVLKARAAMLPQAESTDNRTHAIIGANTVFV